MATHDLEIPINTSPNPRNGNTTPSRRLRVLLLAPSAVSEAKLAETFERVSHFASLTGGEDVAIVFLLHPPQTSNFVSAKHLANGTEDPSTKTEGVYAYSKLQAEMIHRSDIPYVTTLPLSSLEELPALLKRHIAHLSRPPLQQKPAATSFELLQLCTANPPMAQQTAFILSDLFTDLRDLATTCTTVNSAPDSSSPSERAGLSQMSGAFDSSNGLSSQFFEANATSKLKRLRDLVGDQECCDIVDFWKEEWLLE